MNSKALNFIVATGDELGRIGRRGIAGCQNKTVPLGHAIPSGGMLVVMGGKIQNLLQVGKRGARPFKLHAL